MKETNRTSRAVGQLEKMFRICNQHYFNNEIEEPIITIQSTPKAYGHVTVDKTWKKGQKGDYRHELNIGAGTLDRNIEYVASTLIHEMVHLWNLQNGIQDCSRGGTYHNLKFKEKAEQVDLKISKHEKYGWTITEPTDKLIEFCIDNNWNEIKINREEGWIHTTGPDGTPISFPPMPTKTKGIGKQKIWKYQCPKCKISVRATKDLTAKLECIDCKMIMIEV